MADLEFQLNDEGSTFLITCKDETGTAIDVGAATTMNLIMHKPSSSTAVTKALSLNTTGADGKVKYVFETGVLDVIGIWVYQVYIVIGALKLKSRKATFTVKSNIST